MRFRTFVTAAVCGSAAVLTASGCSSASSSSSVASSAPASPASSSPAGPAGSAPASQSPSPSASAAATGETCQPAGLSLALNAESGSATQKTLVVDLTNKGSAACTMNGFAGVNLVGAVKGKQNYTWSLVRSTAKYSQVTLQAGGTAHFDVMYLPGTSGTSGNITVKKIVITPPNTYSQLETTWSQVVVLQDEATHPGTFITPVVPGA
jgi:hypothetical protein